MFRTHYIASHRRTYRGYIVTLLDFPSIVGEDTCLLRATEKAQKQLWAKLNAFSALGWAAPLPTTMSPEEFVQGPYLKLQSWEM